MSEQAAEPTSGKQGSLDLDVSRSADAASEAAEVSEAKTSETKASEAQASEATASEAKASETAAATTEVSAAEPSMSEPSLSAPMPTAAPKVEAAKADAVKAEASTPEPQPEAAKDKISHTPAKVIVMSRGDSAWTDAGTHSRSQADEPQHVFGKRRIGAIAAVLAFATAAGAVGGALATASFMRTTGDVAAPGSQTASLTASLSRIDGDIQALKAGLDHASKLGLSQFNKTTERLDKLERAQAEPTAKPAKLSEAVDKPHALPVPAVAAPAVSSAAKETTGSISSAPQQVAAASRSDGRTDLKADMKGEVGRLPTLDDWVLRDVGYGGALIGSRRGTYEVFAGDVIPGLGRVDAIRRQDGRWVVVTSRGLIVAR